MSRILSWCAVVVGTGACERPWPGRVGEWAVAWCVLGYFGYSVAFGYFGYSGSRLVCKCGWLVLVDGPLVLSVGERRFALVCVRR